jgi:SH3-like domain-containing protein
MRLLIACATLCLVPLQAMADTNFEVLAKDKVFGRRGPSFQHQIDWEYRQRGLPVQILGDSGDWRRVRDPAGSETWVHISQLARAPGVYVRSAKGQAIALQAQPNARGRTVATIKAGVVGLVEACNGDWRRLRTQGQVGWVRKGAVWPEACPTPQG